MKFRTLQPLRRRPFATVWTATVVSDIGTWMQLSVLGALIAKTSSSTLAVGAVMSAQFVPGLIGAPVGGLIADRFDRRISLTSALCAQTVITAVLAVVLASGERRPAVIAALVMFLGGATHLGNAISGSMQPDLVPKEELLAAVSLGSASWNTGRVIGPALGYFVERQVGATGAVVGNAVSFAVMAVAVWSLRKPYRPLATTTGKFFAEIGVGIRTLWATPGCRAALQGLLPMQLCFAALMALLPVIARDLGSGLRGTSQLSSAQGVGAVLGATMVPVLVSRIGRVRTLKVHWVISALMVFSFAFINSMPVAMAAICLFGGAFSGVLITFMALMQHHAPAEKRGRVMSIFMACMGPTYGASVAVQSIYADEYGRHQMHATMATLALVIGIASLAVGAGWHGWKILGMTGTPIGGPVTRAAEAVSAPDLTHPDVGA